MGTHPHACYKSSRNKLAIAAVLTGVFMIVEAIGGVLTSSLALLADAGHMLTDFGALALAFVAVALRNQPANENWPYGLRRAPVLAAFVNGLALLVIAVLIVFEAIHRFANIEEVLGLQMTIIAFTGLCVNIVVFRILHDRNETQLNMKAAVSHVMGDILGSVAAVVAGLAIYFWQIYMIDPILSAFVAIVISVSAIRLLKETGRILMQSAPQGLSVALVNRRLLEEFCEIKSVERTKFWAIDEMQNELSLTLVMHKSSKSTKIDLMSRLNQYLAHEFKAPSAQVEFIEDP